MPKVISRINSVNDGVLVCIDEEKDIYKYLPLEEVKIGKHTLKDVLKSKDQRIEKLEARIKKIETWQIPASELLKTLATEGEE